MTWPVLLFLALQAVVFAAWTWLAFRTLFRLRAMAVRRTGRSFPGPVDFLQTTGTWLRDPGEAAGRRSLGMVTALMVALTVIGVLA